MSRGVDDQRVELAFFMPPEALRPYITTFYHARIVGSTSGAVVDRLHPEWANLRFVTDGEIRAAVGFDKEVSAIPTLAVTGPTSLSTRFEADTMRAWGIGLLPLGWSRLFGVGAADYADRIFDAQREPGFDWLSGMVELCRKDSGDLQGESDAIAAFFLRHIGPPSRRDARIVGVQRALVDPEIQHVGQLADSVGMTKRTLERLSREAFGFPPRLLLARQRFLRSLAQFMLDPTMKWTATLDPQYYDQAHFYRDFNRFMGMSPREYASRPHPVLAAAAHARMAAAGEAMQALHKPVAPIADPK